MFFLCTLNYYFCKPFCPILYTSPFNRIIPFVPHHIFCLQLAKGLVCLRPPHMNTKLSHLHPPHQLSPFSIPQWENARLTIQVIEAKESTLGYRKIPVLHFSPHCLDRCLGGGGGGLEGKYIEECSSCAFITPSW